MSSDDDRPRRSAATVPEAPHARAALRGNVTVPEVPASKRLGGRASEGSPFSVDVGDRLPDVALPNERGVEVPLAALQGGPVLLVFAPNKPSDAAALLGGELAAARAKLAAASVAAVLVVHAKPTEVLPVDGVVTLADPAGDGARAFGVLDPLLHTTRLAAFLCDASGTVVRVWSQPELALVVPLALDVLDTLR